MSNTIRTGRSSGPYPANTTSTVESDSKAAATGASTADPARTINEMTRLQGTLSAGNPTGSTGTTNANGAPRISASLMSMSPGDLAAALLALQHKTQENMVVAGQQGIQIDQEKMAEENAKSLKKLNDWIANSEAAEKKGDKAKKHGWLHKVVKVVKIAAVVTLAAATGGAALIVMAGVTVGMTALKMVNKHRAAQEPPKGPLLHQPLKKVVDALAYPLVKGLELAGVDPEKAKLIGHIAAELVLLAGAVILMATTGKGGKVAAQELSSGMRSLIKVARVASVTATTTEAVVSANKGRLSIEAASLQKHADQSLADQKRIQADIAELQARMEQSTDDLKELLEAMQQSVTVVSQIIANEANMNSQVAANLGGRGRPASSMA